MMRVNLFISSFRKILLLFLFLVALILCNELLTYMLIDDTDSYTRLTMNELYHQEANVDVLFLGTSHCYRSLDTSVTDKILGVNTFNCGSSGQELDASYALLVEAGKKYDLKKVYLEMYYNTYGYDNDERTVMTSTYIVSDYMKLSMNKILYMLNSCTAEHWINAFFPARRNWRRIFESQYISNLIAIKNTDYYKDYKYEEPPGAAEYYAGKGYVASNEAILKENFSKEGHFLPAMRDLSSDNMNDLKRIIEYCDKKDIELICFSAPMPDFRLCDAGDYDLYVYYISNLLSQFDIPYYDFNLCRDNYFTYDSNLFMDDEHLNGIGAEKFSEVFSKFFCGDISSDQLFYSSYKEKICDKNEQTYGLIYSIDFLEDVKNISFEAVQNREFDYCASVFKKAGNMEDFTEVQFQKALDTISLPVSETGQLLIYIFNDEILVGGVKRPMR